MEEVNPFYDVSVSDWYYQYVKYIYDNGIMKGKGPDPGTGKVIFKPNDDVTRAEFAQMLYNMEGKPAVTYEAVFPDVPSKEADPEAWYSDAVIWAYKSGITSGMGDGRFGVDKPISREQMAQFLMKYAKLKGLDISARADLTVYNDDQNISLWAQDTGCLGWAVYHGVITGNGNKMLEPTESASRAEGATMLYKMKVNLGL